MMPRDEPLDGRALLNRLLSSPFIGRDSLLRQVDQAELNWIWERGSPALLIRVDSDAERADVQQRTPLEAEGIAKDVDDVTVHFVLHVVDGYLNEVEVFREDGSPLQRMPTLTDIVPTLA